MSASAAHVAEPADSATGDPDPIAGRSQALFGDFNASPYQPRWPPGLPFFIPCFRSLGARAFIFSARSPFALHQDS